MTTGNPIFTWLNSVAYVSIRQHTSAYVRNPIFGLAWPHLQHLQHLTDLIVAAGTAGAAGVAGAAGTADVAANLTDLIVAAGAAGVADVAANPKIGLALTAVATHMIMGIYENKTRALAIDPSLILRAEWVDTQPLARHVAVMHLEASGALI